MSRPLPPSRARVRTLASFGAALLLAAVLQPAAASEAASSPSTPAVTWSEDVLDLAGSLPVQDDGRVKPLATFARYTFLTFSGSTSLKREGRDRLRPLPWLLDVLFLPEVSADHRVFRVEDDAVLDALGVPHTNRRKRDWYSFRDLQPGLGRLQMFGTEYGARLRKRPPGTLERTEAQIYALFQNVLRYTQLQGSLTFASVRLPVGELPELKRFFGTAKEVPWSAALSRLPELLAVLPPSATKQPKVENATPDQKAVALLLSQLERLAVGEPGLKLLPPPKAEDGTPAGAHWRSPGDVLAMAMEGVTPSAQAMTWIEGLEAVGGALGNEPKFLAALRPLHAGLTARARERGEYDRVPLEVTYHRLQPVTWSKHLFLLGWVLALGTLLLTWLAPGRAARVLGVLAWAVLGGAALLLVGGIVMRCLIMGRPPIKTLYEVTIFIAAAGALTAFVIEWFTRRKLALFLGGFLGWIGVMVAGLYEEVTKTDTMRPLVAVLDSNFWLTFHVTTVVMGYMAGLLAALIAHVYVLGRVFGLGKGQEAFYAGVARAVYGVMCFGLLFSTVGTILGGIWANDSWGRFWGWDPKENGALMIVLWELAMIHARLGGYVRGFGLSFMAVIGGGIVVWSYWGVNNMGVGLHSYGFSEGLDTGLRIFYSCWVGILLAGGLWRFLEWRRAAGSAAAA